MFYSILFTILTCFSFSIQAKLPLYELGLAGGGGYIFDYPAANQGRMKYIAIPTGKYRGQIFRNDRKGTRARFFKNEFLDIDLSFSASFPANSENNDARKGMQDLDWLGEIGPRLNIDAFHSKKFRIEVELPLRYVFSTDFNFTKQRGFRFYPQIDLTKYINHRFKINLSFKMNWATEQLTDYFYEVPQADVTQSRKRFNAKSGYVGGDISTFFSYNQDDIFYIIGMAYRNFSNSANQNSPLFKSKENTTFFIAFNYFFFKSKKKTQHH